MELSQLNYLIVLNRTRNFSRAAEELFITQPTLSQQIKKLEEELGIDLFKRNTRSVTPTKAGELCCLYAAQVMESIRQITKVAKEAKRREAGHIQLGMMIVYPQLNIPQILASFQDTHPNTKMGIQFGLSVDLLDLLIGKDVDIIISNIEPGMIEASIREKIRFTVFLSDHLHAIVSEKHPLANQETVTIEDISNETFFFTDARSSVKIALEHAFSNTDTELFKINSCPSMTSVFNYIGTGMGISVMTRHVAMGYMIPGIKCIPIVPEIVTQTAIITRITATKHQVMREFEEFFLQNIQENETKPRPLDV